MKIANNQNLNLSALETKGEHLHQRNLKRI